MNATAGGPFTSVAALPAPRPDMDLAEMSGAIWRGKWAVAACAALATVAGLSWGIFGAEPRYRATAVIVLETGADPMLDMAQMLPLVTRDGARVNTELEVLRSTVAGIRAAPPGRPPMSNQRDKPSGSDAVGWKRRAGVAFRARPDKVL